MELIHDGGVTPTPSAIVGEHNELGELLVIEVVVRSDNHRLLAIQLQPENVAAAYGPRSLRQRFAVLRDLEVPKLFNFSAVWPYIVGLIAAGTLIGLTAGYGAAAMSCLGLDLIDANIFGHC